MGSSHGKPTKTVKRRSKSTAIKAPGDTNIIHQDMQIENPELQSK